MDIDQYFKIRADLTGRILSEDAADRLLAPDWRFFVAGVLCVATAITAVLWASVTQPDAGYFARTTTFLAFVLSAGVLLLIVAQWAHMSLARVVVTSRDAVRERCWSSC